MARYEFKIITLNRHHLRDDASSEFARLNTEGSDGWHIVAIRDDPRDGSNLVIFLERERAAG